MPTDILGKVILMVLGAVMCKVAGIIVSANRKKMPYEVWIPLLALCAMGAIGLLGVALCLAAAFTIAT